jgi:hypothetical protein
MPATAVLCDATTICPVLLTSNTNSACQLVLQCKWGAIASRCISHSSRDYATVVAHDRSSSCLCYDHMGTQCCCCSRQLNTHAACEHNCMLILCIVQPYTAAYYLKHISRIHDALLHESLLSVVTTQHS